MNSLIGITPAIAARVDLERIAWWAAEAEWRSGEGQRGGARRNLARPGRSNCRDGIRRYDVLDAAETVESTCSRRRLHARSALRRVPRLPGILSPAAGGPVSREVPVWICPRCQTVNAWDAFLCWWCGFHNPRAVLDSDLCAGRAARTTQSCTAQTARPRARARVLSVGRDVVRGDIARAGYRPFPAQAYHGAMSRRADLPEARPPRMARCDRRDAGAAGGLR